MEPSVKAKHEIELKIRHFMSVARLQITCFSKVARNWR
jgi:hypothetical protein